MTAIEETTAPAGGTAGKSTHDSTLLPVGDATQPALPQLPYADAVHTALDALALLPDALETGVRRAPDGVRELFLRLEWLPTHDDLAVPEMHGAGLTLEWSHLGGWLARSGTDVAGPGIDRLADPAVVADTALHAALCGMHCACDKPYRGRRWEHADHLATVLTAYDERTEGVTG
ncbi:hypothetical protein [Streptomyces sp. bgisy154]|uniref:hypothetical protein n=1 Tax=Streptomyces sp. bgisy154 TaxID=3413794 RepID=UPI003D712F58